MKFLKRVFIFVLMLFSYGVFAQNADYKALLKKAQEAEGKKEWVYALGYYIDAITADPVNSDEAYKAFTKLADLIEKGQPGYNSDGSAFSPFEEYEEWTNLLINAEKYWTEYCPYTINVGKLKMGVPDMKTKTAEYTAEISLSNSYKCDLIMKPLMNGYKNAYKKGWEDLPKPQSYKGKSLFSNLNYYNDDNNYSNYDGYDYDDYNETQYLASRWPYVSVSKTVGAKKGTYKKPNDAVSYEKTGDCYILPKDKSAYLNKNVAVLAMPIAFETGTSYNKRQWKEFGIKNIYNAFAYQIPAYKYDSYGNISYYYSLYDLKLRIVDNTGKVIAASKRFLPHLSYNYWDEKEVDKVSFKGITQAQMKLIDSGKAWIEVEGAYLQYGLVNASDYYAAKEKRSENELEFKKKLQEVSIPLDKITVYNPSGNKYDETLSAFGIRKVNDKYNKTPNELVYVNKLYKCIKTDYYKLSKDNEINVGDSFDLKSWYVCNILSLFNGLTPYYDDNGNEKGGNGYRVSNNDEWNYDTDINLAYYFVSCTELSAEELIKVQAEQKAAKDKVIEDFIKKFKLNEVQTKTYGDDIVTFSKAYVSDYEYNSGYYKYSDVKMQSWEICNKLSDLVNIPHYFDDEGEIISKDSEGFRVLSYSEKSRYSLNSGYDTVFASIKIITPEEKAAMLQQGIIRGTAAIGDKQNELKKFSELLAGEPEIQTVNKYLTSISKLEKAIQFEDLADINKYVEDVEKIDLTSLKARAKEAEDFISETTTYYEEINKRVVKAKEVLLTTKSSLNSVENQVASLKKALDSKKASSIKSAKNNLVAAEPKLVEAEKEIEVIEENNTRASSVYNEKLAKFNELEKILGPSYKSNSFSSFKKAVDELSAAIKSGKKLVISQNLVKLESIDISSDEKIYKTTLKKGADENKEALKKYKELFQDAEKLMISESKLKNEYETLKKDLNDLETLFKTADDYVVYQKKDAVLAIVDNPFVGNVKEEKVVYLFDKAGISFEKAKKPSVVDKQEVDSYVMTINRKSLAEKAGIKKGDILIYSFEGKDPVSVQIDKSTQVLPIKAAVEEDMIRTNILKIYYMRGKRIYSATIEIK